MKYSISIKQTSGEWCQLRDGNNWFDTEAEAHKLAEDMDKQFQEEWEKLWHEKDEEYSFDYKIISREEN